MSIQQQLIQNLHKNIRKDKFITEMCKSSGIEMDIVESLLSRIEKNYWFDTMDELGINIMEKQLDFKTDSRLSIRDRASRLEARWKSSGKCNLALLQNVCDSWQNGQIDARFIDGKIKLKFIGKKGVPTDLDGLKASLEKVRPVHALIDYIFCYYLVKDVQTMTIEELETKKINEFAFN